MQLDLELGELLDRFTGQRIGWMGDWRLNGVAHGFASIAPPAELATIGDRLDHLMRHRLPAQVLRAIDRDDWAAQREAEEAERQRRFDEAVAALVAHPEFPAATNLSLRKAVLARLGLDLSGLNKEDIIAVAKHQLPKP